MCFFPTIFPVSCQIERCGKHTHKKTASFIREIKITHQRHQFFFPTLAWTFIEILSTWYQTSRYFNDIDIIIMNRCNFTTQMTSADVVAFHVGISWIYQQRQIQWTYSKIEIYIFTTHLWTTETVCADARISRFSCHMMDWYEQRRWFFFIFFFCFSV